MPGRDGTGPVGQGSMTGRGLGPCGNGIPWGTARGFGPGMGMGMGLGKGIGMGRGMGLGRAQMLRQRINNLRNK